MTVKRRLFVSNILMILVPVCISALIAAGCVSALWYTLEHGAGVGFKNVKEFYKSGGVVLKALEAAVNTDGDERLEHLSDLSKLLNREAVAVTVLRNGKNYFQYGDTTENDAALVKASVPLGGEGILSSGSRSLYAHPLTAKGESFQIYLFSSLRDIPYETLKKAAAAALVVIALAVFLSVLLTNRFLTKFVLQKIERSLSVLVNGVRQIRDGNLDYRIEYAGCDEFSRACSDFNEMGQRLKASVERSRLHEESRRVLMAGISHDLRSPLTSIQAYVEGLLDGVAKTPEARERYLLTVKSKAGDIQRMVSQIFLFSKMELEEYPVHLEVLRLDEEISDFLAETQSEYAGRGLAVSCELCEASVKADPAEIRRVLANVLDNSAKYKQRGQGHMKITLRPENVGFLLTMADDGPGVPPAALPHLFDLFYRSDPSRQNPNQGSGLGLAIAAKALERMNGTISAEESEGGGLKILIRLPREGAKAHEKNPDS